MADLYSTVVWLGGSPGYQWTHVFSSAEKARLWLATGEPGTREITAYPLEIDRAAD